MCVHVCVCLWLKSCVSNPVCTCWHSCTGCQILAWQPHGPEVCSRRGPSTWWNGQEHFLSRQAACPAEPAAAAAAPPAEVAAAGNTAPPAKLAPLAVIVKLLCVKSSWNGIRPKLVPETKPEKQHRKMQPTKKEPEETTEIQRERNQKRTEREPEVTRGAVQGSVYFCCHAAFLWFFSNFLR